MALKNYKARSPGMRFRVSQVRTHLSKEKPVAHLTLAKNSCAGRNNTGRITVRHRGGGVRRRFRIVDFLRDKHGIPAKVAALSTRYCSLVNSRHINSRNEGSSSIIRIFMVQRSWLIL